MAMNASSEKRPIGFVPIGVFFSFGATMATYAAVTLAVPGTILDQAWKLNPDYADAFMTRGMAWTKKREFARAMADLDRAISLDGESITSYSARAQVHGIDAAEKVVVRKQLRRGQVLAFFKALSPCWSAWRPALS